MNYEQLAIILGALLAISELIALTPLKQNSVFQVIRDILLALKPVKKVEDKEEK